MSLKSLAMLHLLLALSIGLGITGFSSYRQLQFNQWFSPERIPGYTDESDVPYILADSQGTVHAFGSQEVGEESPIVYSSWNPTRGWTDTTDIILPVHDRFAKILGASLDNRGMVHLIFYSGNDLRAEIYYTRAPVQQVSQASAWQKPMLIGEDALGILSAALITDERGHLLVAYTGYVDGVGLYSVHSLDYGENWTAPRVVSLSESEDLFPSHINMVVDVKNQVHMAWSVTNQRGNGEAIAYARLDANYTEWARPVILVNSEGYEADWPSLFYYQDELLLIYNNNQPPTRWMRKSQDDGQTWSDPVRPFYHIGEYGPAAFTVDSAGTLHMLLGNRIGTPATHGMWHSIWQGGVWSNLIPVISGPPSRVRGAGFDPHMPKAVTVLGNVLFVVWKNDTGFNGPWYSYTRVQAADVPPAPPPTPVTPTVQARPAMSDIQLVTPTAQPFVLDEEDMEVSDVDPAASLVGGVAPVVLFLLISVAFIVRWNGRHRGARRFQ